MHKNIEGASLAMETVHLLDSDATGKCTAKLEKTSLNS